MFRDGPFQCQELKFGRMIILFIGGKDLAAIDNWVILPICLFLGKHCPQSLLRSVCFE